ncbi:hypothetical protein [Roseateles amylovorans]|uniref:CHAT domain-containing protein n=1 Tax=Roseateles amylovorans TaxID=2978473 RepID=A0ABY6AW56_9BURK|nr:hypothetical protein [Roseateles amylovorans]UXH76830.1 hypothetical protein N4261_17555 [Roseateles amylovorans]
MLDPAAVSRLPDGVDDLRVSLLGSLDERGLCTDRMLMNVQDVGGGFMASETLFPRTQRRWTTCGARTAQQLIHNLKGEVAAALGQVLLERCQWTRPVALEREGFDRLAGWLTDAEAHALAWSLRLDPQASRVNLMVIRKRRLACQGAVLRIEPYLKGAVILPVFPAKGPNDGPHLMIDNMVNRYNSGREIQVGSLRVPERMKASVDGHAPLAHIGSRTRLVIVGHGGRLAPFEPTSDAYTADHLEDQTPEALADLLARQGLRKDFSGTVFVESCFSASGLGRTDTYVHRLRDELARRGYRQLSVAGRPGESYVGPQSTLTLPNEHHFNIVQTQQRSLAFSAQLRARLDELAERTGGLEQAQDAEILQQLMARESMYQVRLSRMREKGPYSQRHIDALNAALQACGPDESVPWTLHPIAYEDLEHDMVADMWSHIGPGPAPQVDGEALRRVIDRLGITLDERQSQRVQAWASQIAAGRPLPVDGAQLKRLMDGFGIPFDPLAAQQIMNALWGDTGSGSGSAALPSDRHATGPM